MTDSTIPRRAEMQYWVPAERAIQQAVDAVEDMAPDVRLTDAVVLLARARDRVADFVDGVAVSPVGASGVPDTKRSSGATARFCTCGHSRSFHTASGGACQHGLGCRCDFFAAASPNDSGGVQGLPTREPLDEWTHEDDTNLTEAARMCVQLRDMLKAHGSSRAGWASLLDTLRKAGDLLHEGPTLRAQLRASEASRSRMQAVVEAARHMPTATPFPGGTAKAHWFAIEAGVVWSLDRALTEHDTSARSPHDTPPREPKR